MKQDIYDPEFVADVFDRCSARYRNWSGIASFGLIRLWRKQCVAHLDLPADKAFQGVDLMAGTGEIWPHFLHRFPKTSKINAVDISPKMHEHALELLHRGYKDQITHLCANFLDTDLPSASADFAVSTFGLKTFNAEQHRMFAIQMHRILKPGAPFALVEAADPKGWTLRPFYRLYLDRMLPMVERYFLNGANDFSMIGEYTRRFETGQSVSDALRDAGFEVTTKKLTGGSAMLYFGRRPS